MGISFLLVVEVTADDDVDDVEDRKAGGELCAPVLSLIGEKAEVDLGEGGDRVARVRGDREDRDPVCVCHSREPLGQAEVSGGADENQQGFLGDGVQEMFAHARGGGAVNILAADGEKHFLKIITGNLRDSGRGEEVNRAVAVEEGEGAL